MEKRVITLVGRQELELRACNFREASHHSSTGRIYVHTLSVFH